MSSNIHTSQTFTFQGKTLQEALEEVAMAIPMILALTIAPALLGTQEAIRQSQSKNKREEHRARRCNLVVSCVKQSIRSRDINGKLVVLKDNKLYITTGDSSTEGDNTNAANTGHPFAGYYLPYPDKPYEGLVSTISDDPPMLNWIYVDKDTYEVKYGVRADAQPHITGPFDCTRQDRRMTLEGWEGFAAVEEFPGIWALYFDRDDDGLITKVPMGTRVLEVELTRREKKERKPEPDPNQAQTLDEKMKQHKEQTQREEEEKQEMLRSQQQTDATEQANPEPLQQDRAATEDQATGEANVDGAQLDLSKLHLDPNSHAEHTSGTIPHSPSVATDNISFWSAARKADGLSDTASVTAASSITDRLDTLEEQADELSGPGYKKPYVEDEVVAEEHVNST
ncbi:uncharacterized protein F4812DRAFT_454515 [Daldinia caldariorum]|uniref:uncharacterized protein n=1 Tax=Daldinia caldariorum TaxID=326644 RepID=UPI002008AC54|nr:uncharacterized protein F4812DRAFT_454515 [Daldinia caldariorum]KAI1472702.1 hypothetical protein F4812DRAFT_454515 [Daldinia caldariorum]